MVNNKLFRTKDISGTKVCFPQDFNYKHSLASEAWIYSYVVIGPQDVLTQVTMIYHVPKLLGYCKFHTLLYFYHYYYIFFLYFRQETNCGVEQMLRGCASVVLFLFYLLSRCIVSHTSLDTGPYVALWSGNVFEKISVIFTEILAKLNAIVTKHFFSSCPQKTAFFHFLLFLSVS